MPTKSENWPEVSDADADANLKRIVREAIREELDERDRRNAEIQAWWLAQSELSRQHAAQPKRDRPRPKRTSPPSSGDPIR